MKARSDNGEKPGYRLSEFSDALGVGGSGGSSKSESYFTHCILPEYSTWGKKDEDYRDYIKCLFNNDFFFLFWATPIGLYIFLIAKSAVLENADRRTDC